MPRPGPSAGLRRRRAVVLAALVVATGLGVAGQVPAVAAPPAGAGSAPAEQVAPASTAPAVTIPGAAMLHRDELPRPAFFDPWIKPYTEYNRNDFEVNHACAAVSLTALGAQRVTVRWFHGVNPAQPEATNGAQHVVAVFPDRATAPTAYARITSRIDRCEQLPDVAPGMVTRRTATFRDPRAAGSVWYASFPTWPQGNYVHTHFGVVRSGRAVSVVNVDHTGMKSFGVRDLLPTTRTAGERLARTVR